MFSIFRLYIFLYKINLMQFYFILSFCEYTFIMIRITTFEQYQKDYQFSIKNPEDFWAEQAREFLWKKPWSKVLDGDFSSWNIEWFKWGELNITENCLDRHLPEKANDIAYYLEHNTPTDERKVITYWQLFEEVCQFSNVLKKNGVKKWDRVCLYMPMIIESVIAMLACARIWAIHCLVFWWFSARALADRILDAGCSLVITSDWAFRWAKVIQMKKTVDGALIFCPKVTTVIVCEHVKLEYDFIPGRDQKWHEIVEWISTTCPAESMQSNDPLFILYTSGSTGKPKWIVHTCAGYMVYAGYSFENVFQYNSWEIFWCTADIGWITGHSYGVYGPLLLWVTSLLFEWIPTYPDASRYWQIIDRYGVNILYTAPTIIRSLESYGLEYVTPYSLSSLRLLGSVWEPIDESAWNWYHTHIGKNRCPIVDTWWQTETGGIMISALPGITSSVPSFATLPLPGIQPLLIDEEGDEVKESNTPWNLCIRFPWPGLAQTIHWDSDRYRETFFSLYPWLYFTGDGWYRDKHWNYRITGRVDDVMNISWHRISSAEIENAINLHPLVVESAVVGYPHPIKWEWMYAFVVVNNNSQDLEVIQQEIVCEIKKNIGSFAKIDIIQFVTELPKTRSGKIVRRILRKIANWETENFWDISTLLDSTVVEEILKSKN